jgi:arsenate reductase (thioredoxin)
MRQVSLRKNEHVSKRNVLFLCTGNSCRSQMAEAIVNARLGAKWHAFSAGTEPAGFLHPKALTVLAEIGIEVAPEPPSETLTGQE